MNAALVNIIHNERYMYIIVFALCVCAFLFRQNMALFVAILIGICLMFREEIKGIVLEKPDKIQVKKQQMVTNTHINQTAISRNLLKEFRKYKKYNRTAYRKGKRYLLMFFDEIQGFSESTNKLHSLDNAELYSQQSLKSFRSIIFSIPETMRGSVSTKEIQQRLAELCDTLENHIYKIMYGKVQINNRDFMRDPDIYKCEKIYDTDNVKQSNYYNQYELS